MGSAKPWYLLPNASYLLFYERGCFSEVRSEAPRGSGGSGGGDAVYERRVSRAPLICLTGGCPWLLVTAYGLGWDKRQVDSSGRKKFGMTS